MTTVYSEHEHTHCLVKHPKAVRGEEKWLDEAWEGYQPIILHTGSHVWVSQSYCGEGHPEVRRVGDSRDNGYDTHGCCILSVPAEWCTYGTDEDVEMAQMARDAEDDAYGVWHGSNR